MLIFKCSDEKTKEQFGLLPENLEELQDLLATERAKASLNVDTDPHLVEQFREREKQIRNLENKLLESKESLEALNEGMQETRDSWEPKLDELGKKIGDKFSEYFGSILVLFTLLIVV